MSSRSWNQSKCPFLFCEHSTDSITNNQFITAYKRSRRVAAGIRINNFTARNNRLENCFVSITITFSFPKWCSATERSSIQIRYPTQKQLQWKFTSIYSWYYWLIDSKQGTSISLNRRNTIKRAQKLIMWFGQNITNIRSGVVDIAFFDRKGAT